MIGRSKVTTALLILACFALEAPAQESCFDFLRTIFDTSNNPAAVPTNPRAYDVDVMYWNGTPYLWANLGNGISFWDISNPETPLEYSNSSVNWLNIIPDEETDRDHFLFNFAMCDGCRYGLVGLDTFGTIFFDLGIANQPRPTSSASIDRSLRGRGGMVYESGGIEYAIVPGLSQSCGAGSTVAIIQGASSSALQPVGCVENTTGPIQIDGGFSTFGAGGQYLYLFDTSTSRAGNIFRVDGSSLTFLGSPFVGAIRRVRAAAIDQANSLLATALNSLVTIWDISTPDQPQMLATFTVPIDNANSIAIGYPWLWVARPGSQEAALYNITVPTAPQAMSDSLWAEGWNQVPLAGHINASVDPTASTLYLARYSVLQVLGSDGTCGSGPPSANLSVSPTTVFPGDAVTLSDFSAGTIHRRAMWVEDRDGTVVAGSSTLSASNPTSLQFSVPLSSLADPYTAIVAVENDDNPYVSNSPGNQEERIVLDLDLSPQLELLISTTEVITGDLVSLSHSAEGSPASVTWFISPPVGANCPSASPWNGGCSAETGQVDLLLADSGEWQIDLSADYAHGYQATDSLVLFLTSVVASLQVPSSPAEDAPITLLSTSRFGVGVEPSYTWTLRRQGVGAYSECPDDATCIVPADTLVPGDYEVELKVVNTANGDLDSATADLTVVSGEIFDLDFSPTSPEIGETVQFALTGVSAGEIETVDWFFDAEGCNDAPANQVCDGTENVCLWAEHAYSSSGVKGVRVVANLLAGETVAAGPKTVTVSPSGECQELNDCTYILDPEGAAVATGGVTDRFFVDASTEDCSTDATANVAWITLIEPEGSGDRNIEYSVTANTVTNERVGRITIGGRAQFDIIQDAGIDFSWSPTTPSAGTLAVFRVDGIAADEIESIDWDFGEAGCGQAYPQTTSCATATSGDCSRQLHAFEHKGRFEVRASLRLIGGESSQYGPKTIVVDEGVCAASCEWNVGPTADFEVSPELPAIGDSVSFFDRSTANTDEFEWNIHQDETLVHSSSSQDFSYTFEQSGTYVVSLLVRNCRGEDTTSAELEVIEARPPADLIVPTTIAAPGLNDTRWKSDLRIFNPNDDALNLTIEFLAQATDNSGADRPSIGIHSAAKSTIILDDIVRTFSVLLTQDAQGALLITIDDDARVAAAPLVLSRVYNDTPTGSYGQFVPAVSVDAALGETITLSGLASNGDFRTNVGLANLSDRPAGGIVIAVLDPEGIELGTYSLGIPALSTIQVVNIAERAGIQEDLDLFTVEIFTNGKAITALASVVDNFTGDPVLLPPQHASQSTLMILPGMAHAPGVNDSQWRSFLSLHNPTDQSMEFELKYVPDSSNLVFGLNKVLAPKQTSATDDIIATMVSDDVSKGYFIIESQDGWLPAVTARTYNQAELGTFGQNVIAFTQEQMLGVGELGYLPGVANSAAVDSGFRTNLGFVNGGQSETKVDITIYDSFGQRLTKIPGFPLAAGAATQFNIFQAIGLGSAEIEASIELEVKSGGPIAAYASVVENLSQDPILIPVTILGR